jgi:3-oxoadipate enol-lactonase
VPTAEINGTTYEYLDEGSGPLIVFGHGLLASKEMFRAQIDALADRYRCVSINWPGHGKTTWKNDTWTFWELGEDAAALASTLSDEPAVYVGLSQGGFAFMRLAMSDPDAVRALVLLDTSAGPENVDHLDGYKQLAEMLRTGDDETRRQAAMGASLVLYGETWRNAQPEQMEHELQLMLSHPPEGIYLAAHAVFDRDDVTERLGDISAPTLVVCGEEDASTPPELSRVLAERIPDAELVMIPDAGHHTPIERPEPVTEAIEAFLARIRGLTPDSHLA